jgi:proline iminopeptidase
MLDGISTTIRFDPHGCGRSEKAETYSVTTSLADLEAIRQHFNLSKWIVIGHSWGADLALCYALHYPEHVLGFVCLAGGRTHNDREWHRIYQQKRDAGLEPPLAFDYPTNLDVNKQVNQSWREYIQRPTLLRDIVHLNSPALFIYGTNDIRPSWAVEQVAHLLPHGRLRLLQAADHYLWHDGSEQLGKSLRRFVRAVGATQHLLKGAY